MSHSIKKIMCGMCLASLLAMALPVAGLPDSISYDKAFAAEVGTGAIKDGSYKISYMIKKFGTEQASVMQDYVITPGTLTVAGGKYYMTVTLKQENKLPHSKSSITGR